MNTNEHDARELADATEAATGQEYAREQYAIATTEARIQREQEARIAAEEIEGIDGETPF